MCPGEVEVMEYEIPLSKLKDTDYTQKPSLD